MTESGYWSQRRFGRRAALRGAGAAALGMAGAALVGCGSSEEAPPEPGAATTPTGLQAAEERARHTEGEAATGLVRGTSFSEEMPWKFEQAEPVRGGTFLHYITADPQNFSPYHTGGFFLQEFYDYPWMQLFRGDRLFFFRGIESIEWVDATNYLLKVADASFQNVEPVFGRKVTAEDVVSSWELRRDDNTAGAGAYFREIIDWSNTGVVDEQTIKIATVQPRNDFFTSIQVPWASKEANELHLSGKKPFTEWDWPTGSGPFALKEVRPGSAIETVRHPGYSRADITYVDGQRFSLIPDAAAREAQFRAGQLHQLPGGDSPFYEGMLRELGSGSQPRLYGVHNLGLNPWSWIQVNQLREPWTDERVRTAFVRALDRPQIRQLMGEIEGPLNPPGATAGYADYKLPADDADVVDWNKFDPADGKRLLDAARSSGVDVDRTLDFVFLTSTFNGDLAATVRPYLQDVGFKVDLLSMPSADARERVFVRPGRFDISVDNWLMGGFRLGMYFRAHHSNSLFANQNGSLLDAEIDRLVEEWEGLVDITELHAKAQEIERALIQKRSVLFPLYTHHWRKLYNVTVRNTNPDWADALQPQHWVDPSLWPA
jgi:peptide/nickel transport system substrate-binding protein